MEIHPYFSNENNKIKMNNLFKIKTWKPLYDNTKQLLSSFPFTDDIWLYLKVERIAQKLYIHIVCFLMAILLDNQNITLTKLLNV